MRRRRLVAIAAGAVIVAALVAVAALAFPTGTVGRVAAGPVRVPASLEGQMFAMCLPDTGELTAELDKARSGAQPEAGALYLTFSTEGSGRSFTARVEAPGAWRVEASRSGVAIVDEQQPVPTDAVARTPAAVAFAQQFYSCLSQYHFIDETPPIASSAQLVQRYRYDTAVLWPCLEAHGLDVGDPPTRADFADPFRAQAVDPYRGVNVTSTTLPRVLAAVRECPLNPAYLN